MPYRVFGWSHGKVKFMTQMGKDNRTKHQDQNQPPSKGSGQNLNGPLTGVRVLDLSRILAGPFASQQLGDLGAEILKIKRPVDGDDTRKWGSPFASIFAKRDRHCRSLAD